MPLECHHFPLFHFFALFFSVSYSLSLFRLHLFFSKILSRSPTMLSLYLLFFFSSHTHLCCHYELLILIIYYYYYLPDTWLLLITPVLMIIIYLQIVYWSPLIYSYARPITVAVMFNAFRCTARSDTGAELYIISHKATFINKTDTHTLPPFSWYSSFETSTPVEQLWTGLETRVKTFCELPGLTRLPPLHKLVSSSTVTAVHTTTTTTNTDHEPPPTNSTSKHTWSTWFNSTKYCLFFHFLMFICYRLWI